MLRASRRLLREGGRTAFYAIVPPDDLIGTDFVAFDDIGPPYLGLARSYRELAAAAGFHSVTEYDATAAFLQTAMSYAEQTDALAAELAEILGTSELAERTERNRRRVAAIAAGRLRRVLVVAAR